MKNVTATGVALVLVTVAASGEDRSTAEKSNAQIAHELANPNNSLGALNLPIDYISYKGDLPGAGSQDSWRATFQPVLPYPLAKGVNLFFRPAIPFLKDQPVPQLDGGFDGSDWELGDISFDLAIGKTFPGKFVMVGGLAGSLDTASDDDVGLGQTLLGPELAVAQLFNWGVLGLLVNHSWDVAGDNNFDTSITGGQYFYTYNLSDGWQIQSQPVFSYNHEVKNGDEKWTLPVGVGIAKTTRIGSFPWKFSLQYWHYVKQAEALGPDFDIRFQLGPVVPLPW